MSVPVADNSSFPGPAALGRGLVISPGDSVPDEAQRWPRLLVDDNVVAKPADAVAELDELWRHRTPSVVELAVPVAALKAPEATDIAPYELSPSFSFERERLHFLVWVNRYDGRTGPPRWPHLRRAMNLGATELPVEHTGAARGDVTLPDGSAAWVDGGPRCRDLELGSTAVVHVNQVWSGSLVPDRPEPAEAELAPDQQAAVEHNGGAARVLAPAGSGKTRVLTERLRHLLVDRGWEPSSVTALAYNSRAAAEMRQRTQGLATSQVRTLHSLGYEVVGRALGGRPSVLSERDVRRLLEGLVTTRPKANDDMFAPYLDALAEVRAALRPPAVVEEARGDVPGFAELFDEYRARLRRKEAIDHDEQIYGAVEALLRDPELRATMQKRCAHVLLDELQDVTPAQLLLVRLLAAPAYDVYGVGDDDQVIYGYAGADPRFLVHYDTYFPGAASFLLDVNYRCPPAVVEAAGKLLVNNRVREAKHTAARPGRAAEDTDLTVEAAPEDELGERLLTVVQAKLTAGASPSDIAVLGRVNAGLLAPQVLLSEAGVPVQTPLDDGLLGRTGLRAALAWLRLAQAAGDGQLLDGRDLAVAARRPPRKLSRGMVDALGRGEWSLSRLASFASGVDKRGMRQGLEALHKDLEWMGTVARSGRPTAALLAEVRDSVGLGGALGALDGARSSPRGGHVDDLDALVLVARAQPEAAAFEPWLREVLRRRPQEAGSDTTQQVVLSTVHRVKGLEWPHVLVWDATDGVLPHHLNQTGDELEEERRVFHVALTRGRETVTVLTRSGRASPFLAEMEGKRPAPARGANKAAVLVAAPSAADEPGPETAARVTALKEWRRERAEADGVPAFVVLSDRHLEGIAARHPASLDELARCDGIGPTKLDRYGSDILSVLAER